MSLTGFSYFITFQASTLNISSRRWLSRKLRNTYYLYTYFSLSSLVCRTRWLNFIYDDIHCIMSLHGLSQKYYYILYLFTTAMPSSDDNTISRFHYLYIFEISSVAILFSFRANYFFAITSAQGFIEVTGRSLRYKTALRPKLDKVDAHESAADAVILF